MEYVLTTTKTETRAGSYYDKIASVYDLTFKINGYGRSLNHYFANYPLPVSRGAKILDAGCGTGLLTLALLRALHFPVSITALDLSATSISAARKALEESPGRTRDVTFTEGNLLSLPFADNSLDLVVTSGALEYVPLGEGMTEVARVIAPGGHLLHLPCPSRRRRVHSSRFYLDSSPIRAGRYSGKLRAISGWSTSTDSLRCM